MRRLISLLELCLSMLVLAGLPVGLLLTLGPPRFSVLSTQPNALDVVTLIVWLAWSWCILGIIWGVGGRVRRRDTSVSLNAHRLERLTATLAGAVLALTASFSAPLSAAPLLDRTPSTPIVADLTSPFLASDVSPPSQSSTYLVQSGDCLWTISEALYGDGDLWPMLAKMNLGKPMSDGRVFLDPSLIMPGWILEIPPVAPVQVAPLPAKPPLAEVPIAPRPASSSPHIAPTPQNKSVGIAHGAVVVAPALGTGLLLLGLVRRHRKRQGTRAPDELVDLDIELARVDDTVLPTLIEQAVWLADKDKVLTEPMLLEVDESGARFFANGSPRWQASAGELSASTLAMTHAPGVLLPLGERDGTTWAVVVPPGSYLSLAGTSLTPFLENVLSLQQDFAWGDSVHCVDDVGQMQRTASFMEEGNLLVLKELSSDIPDDCRNQSVGFRFDEDADIMIGETSIEVSSRGLSIPRSFVSADTATLIGEAGVVLELKDAPLPSSKNTRDPRFDGAIVRLLCVEPRVDGVQTPIEPKRVRRATELLAYLSLHHPDPITSDRLRSRVLGTSEKDAASKTLFNVASAARHALGTRDGEPLLPRATRSGLYRSGEYLTSDISLLESSFVLGGQADDPEFALAHYRAGFELIESEPMATVLLGYEWFDAEGHRGRLETLLEHAVTSFLPLALEQGFVELAAFGLERAQLVVPYSELFAEFAMEIAAARGDRPGVAKAFERIVQLVDELDPGSWPRSEVERRYKEIVASLEGRERPYANFAAMDAAPLSTSPSAPAAL